MSSFRGRRPSAAFIVSLVALVLALGGTAYAGIKLGKNSVGNKQLKNGAVTTKKIKNKAVTAGKINTKGLTVPNATRANSAGTAGSAAHATNADSATNATTAGHASSADTATTASSPTTLASGKSETGIFAVGGEAAAGSAEVVGPVTFTFPLASAPSVHVIGPGGASTTQCPGSLTNPQAASGNFCLYEGVRTNVASVTLGDPVGNAFNQFSRFGGQVNVSSTSAGFFVGHGSWAVTAP